MRTREMVVAVVIGVVAGGAGRAGDLNPPAGPIEGTMKTLEEVEPRTAITALPYTIDEPGSYYLTGDLTTAGYGFFVIASDVTIDLMGFTITGPGPQAGTSGLEVSDFNIENLTVRNGTFRSFESGVVSHIDDSGNGSTVEGVRVLDAGLYGIDVRGTNNLVQDCYASVSEAGSMFLRTGIFASGGVITNCRTSGFNYGIGGTLGVVITDCVAVGADYGFVVSEGIVRGCAVKGASMQSILLLGDAVAVDNYAP